MHGSFGVHASEESLERYSMGTLGQAETATLEEHLLVCSQCQDRLTETDAFIRATRQAARKLQSRRSPARGKYLPRALLPKPIWAAVAAFSLVFAAAGVWTLRRQHQAPPVAVALETFRGGLPGAQAPAGRPLLLRVDLTGLPESAAYDLEVVNAQGRSLRRVAIRRTAAPAQAEVAGLERGQYWVRLHGPPPQRELLREFGLRVE